MPWRLRTRVAIDEVASSASPPQIFLWVAIAYGCLFVAYWIVDDRRSASPLLDSLPPFTFLLLLLSVLLRGRWRAPALVLLGGVALPVLDLLLPHLRPAGAAVLPLVGLLITAFVLGYERRPAFFLGSLVLWVAWGVLTERYAGMNGFTWQFVIPASLLFGTAGWSVGLVARRRRTAEEALSTLTERRRRERIGLARELHDSVARDLTIIAMQSAVLRSTDRPDEQEYARDAIETTARSGLDALKRLLVVLRAEEAVESPGLVRDLDAENLQEALGSAVRHLVFLGFQATSSATPPDLPRAAETTAVRVVREGTTNITKHAPLGAVCHLDASVVDGLLVVRVANEREATSPATPRTPSTGLGLDSLAERLRLLGGSLDAGPVGATWVLEAHIPLTAPLAGSVGAPAAS